MVQDGNIFLTLAALGLAKTAMLYAIKAHRPKDMRVVAKVQQLNVYPVKGCKGISVDEGFCGKWGLQGAGVLDRQWMIIKSDGRFVTLRDDPHLWLVSVSVEGDQLCLDAEGFSTLRVPLVMPRNTPVVKCIVHGDATEGYDCGVEAGAWFDRFLKQTGHKLVCAAPELAKRITNRLTKRLAEFAREDDEMMYSDTAAYLLLSQGSVDDLVARLDKDAKVTSDNFRPNIIVTGCDAFKEDKWQTLHIGGTQLWQVKACQRCPVTTVDPATGCKLPRGEPLTTLRKYRNIRPDIFRLSPLFGIHCNVLTPGKIRVGDAIYANEDTPYGYLM